MNTIIAKSPATGLYFNGTAFEEINPAKALALRPGTTPESFLLSWGPGIIVEEHIRKDSIPPEKKARLHIIECNNRGQHSFTIRCMDGKYISRRVYLPENGPDRSPWIKFQGVEMAVTWSDGELALGLGRCCKGYHASLPLAVVGTILLAMANS